MKKLVIPTKLTYFGTDSISNLEMFQKIIKQINFVLSLISFDIFPPGWNMKKPLCLCVLTNFFFGFFLHFYDLYLYRNDLPRFFFFLMSMTGFLKGLIKLYLIGSKTEEMLELARRIESLLKNIEKNSKMNEILEKWMIIVCHMIVTCMIIFTGSDIIDFLSEPRILTFWRKVLFFGFELPFLDWNNSNLAYALNLGWHLWFIFVVATGWSSVVVLSAFIIIMTFGQFEVLRALSEELDKFIKKNKGHPSSFRIK